jgi:acyl-CoA synthetase (AMP-forming)/AMP-acid ligase II
VVIAMKTAQQAILHHLTATPDATSMTFFDAQGAQDVWSFGRLDAAARGWAGWLDAAHIAPGDRILSLLPTSPALVVTMLGDLMAGAIHVPVNPAYGAVELGHILRDSGAALVLVEAGSAAADHLRELEVSAQVVELDPAAGAPAGARRADITPRADADAALCIYTSGTTGASKGAVLSWGAVAAGIGGLTALWRWDEADVVSLMLPLFHVHGLGIGVFGGLIRGARLLIHPRFAPETLAQDITARGATVFMGVPTMYARLIEAMERDPGLAASLRGARLFTAGSAALSAAQFARFEALTGHRILERYGMSETLLTLSNPYEPALRRPGTVGHPLPGIEARIIAEDGHPCGPDEPGELCVRGPSVMTGYWGSPERTALVLDAAGWLKTGDMAARDADGYIRILGRMSTDFIKSGGYKISAREIEEALADHPDIAQVAIFGAPDPVWGELVAAAVVPAEGVASRDEAAWVALLGELLRERLADYKRPRRVVVLDALPRNALGKILKRALRC